MKDLFFKYWKTATIVLLIGFIAISGIVINCTGKSTEKMITQASSDGKLVAQKHDLDSTYLTKSSKVTSDLQVANKKISDGLKPVIIYQKADAQKKVADARRDSNMTVSSDSAMTAQERYEATLEHKTVVDSTQIKLDAQQDAIKDSLISSYNKSYQDEVRINANLTAVITKLNKGASLKWWFLAAGVIGGILIVK